MLSRLRRSRTPGPSTVVLISRAGCHLCQQAEPVVARLAAEAGVAYEVRSVDDDPQLRAQWTDHVPVVLLDGVEHSRWWVDEAVLREALGRPAPPRV